MKRLLAALLAGFAFLAGARARATPFSVDVSTLYITGGNVGVGTTNPGTVLDVNGGATVRGQETITSSVTIQGVAAAQGGLTVTGTSNSTFYGSTMTVGPGGIVSAPSQPYIDLTITYNQQIPSNVYTPIYWSGGPGSQNMYRSPASSATFVVPAGGYYLVSFYLQYSSSPDPTTSGMSILVVKNASNADGTGGTTVLWSLLCVRPPVSYGQTQCGVTGTVSLNAGDTLQGQVYQNSGSPITTAISTTLSFMKIHKMLP